VRRLANGTYHYRCSACQSKGELQVPEALRTPFVCPAGCGAVYVQYRAHRDLHLRCVARPLLDYRRPSEEEAP
jgi:hypothetical protein